MDSCMILESSLAFSFGLLVKAPPRSVFTQSRQIMTAFPLQMAAQKTSGPKRNSFFCAFLRLNIQFNASSKLLSCRKLEKDRGLFPSEECRVCQFIARWIRISDYPVKVGYPTHEPGIHQLSRIRDISNKIR